MDIYCKICTEPLDSDELHDVAAELNSTFAAVAKDFRERGCKALEATHGPQTHCVPAAPEATEPQVGADPVARLLTEVYELLGDDMDGAASCLDEARYSGLL